MQGRKPQYEPVVLKNLLDHEAEVPDPPDYLVGRAVQVWPMIVKELTVRHIYDTDCREQAAQYCVQFARWLTAEEHIEKHGTIIKVTKYIGRGVHQKEITEYAPNPNITVSDKASDRMLRIAAELGLTPTARRRIAKVQKSGKAEADPALSRWLKPAA